MSKAVEFFFDFGSPTTYLAWTQLPALCEETGTDLIYRPMLLGGVFQATGNQSPVMIPLKARFMLKDLQRFARRYQVPMQFNPHFPLNTLTLMRMATGVQMREPERFGDFVASVFQAMWVDGLNLADPAVLGQVLQAAGFDPQALLALAGEPAVKEKLKATTEEAVRRGVFGAPSLFVGDELFFGQDRLDFVREALLAHPAG
jgi:2-hydroxychromene-2-carboxylate isomerase